MKLFKSSPKKKQKEEADIPMTQDELPGSASSTNFESSMALKPSSEESSCETRSSSQNSEDRANWGNRVEFILACVGYSVGLGNVWRFGYLSAKSGGGAFIIPYFVCLCIVALPLMLMEFSVGQFTQRGPIGAINMLCPLLKGTGIATVVISFFLTTYYIVIIAWDMYYLFSSFTLGDLPWSSCNNTWNTPDCWDGSLNISFKQSNISRSPSEEYYRYKILNESSSIEEFGSPKLDLVLLIMLAYVVVYFCIWKGVKSTGKVVYVTAIFPYVVLIIMLIRGLTLPGASKGLAYFWVPRWGDLLKPSVWSNAAIQNFNSIGVAFGGLISMSSYNKRNKKILGDVLAIGCIDAMTSLICGSMVFSIMGYIAETQSRPIDDVIVSGPGLVFMVIPEAIRNMSLAPLWGILFFSMIFLLGIDSQFTMVETIITAIEDEFSHLVKKIVPRREILVLIVCCGLFLLSLPNTCPGGIFYFTILDHHSAGVTVFYIAFFEIIAVIWAYGGLRLRKNVYLMNRQRASVFFVACWYVLSPVLVFGIWLLNWVQYESVKYENRSFNWPAQLFGWCVSFVSLLAIPAGALHTLLNTPGKTFRKRLVASIQPTIPDIDPVEESIEEKSSTGSGGIIKKNRIDIEPMLA